MVRSTDEETRRLRIGYVPLLDAAGILALVHKGFAEDEGLHVTVHRERSWAATRDKLAVGYLDAAHLLAPIAVASRVGLGNPASRLSVPLMLSANGNEVTVSAELAALCENRIGYRPSQPGEWGAALASIVRDGAGRGAQPFTIGLVFPFSSHAYLMRRWLCDAGLDPDRDVNLVVIPPQQMADALADGMIDAFCAGPPWGRLAEDSGRAVLAFRAVQLVLDAPEKALAIGETDRFRDPETLARLIRATHAASRWADAAENRHELVELLSRPDTLALPATVIEEALGRSGMQLFGEGVNRPSDRHARWIFHEMQRWHGIPDAREPDALAAFRADLYDGALPPVASTVSTRQDLPDSRA